MNDHRHRKAQFHDIIHEHFDIIQPGGVELELAENRDVDGVVRSVIERKAHLVLP